jgi:hypothetical protein
VRLAFKQLNVLQLQRSQSVQVDCHEFTREIHWWLGRFVAWELLNVPSIALDAKHFCLVNFTRRLLPSIGGNLKPQERMVLK